MREAQEKRECKRRGAKQTARKDSQAGFPRSLKIDYFKKVLENNKKTKKSPEISGSLGLVLI